MWAPGPAEPIAGLSSPASGSKVRRLAGIRWRTEVLVNPIELSRPGRMRARRRAGSVRTIGQSCSSIPHTQRLVLVDRRRRPLASEGCAKVCTMSPVLAMSACTDPPTKGLSCCRIASALRGAKRSAVRSACHSRRQSYASNSRDPLVCHTIADLLSIFTWNRHALKRHHCANIKESGRSRRSRALHASDPRDLTKQPTGRRYGRPVVRWSTCSSGTRTP